MPTTHVPSCHVFINQTSLFVVCDAKSVKTKKRQNSSRRKLTRSSQNNDLKFSMNASPAFSEAHRRQIALFLMALSAPRFMMAAESTYYKCHRHSVLGIAKFRLKVIRNRLARGTMKKTTELASIVQECLWHFN